MRAGIIHVMLLGVSVVGCRKEKADPPVPSTPTSIMALGRDESPPAARSIDIELPNTRAPVTGGNECTSEAVGHSISEVQQALQRNQQIMDSLIRRLAKNSPVTE